MSRARRPEARAAARIMEEVVSELDARLPASEPLSYGQRPWVRALIADAAMAGFLAGQRYERVYGHRKKGGRR